MPKCPRERVAIMSAKIHRDQDQWYAIHRAVCTEAQCLKSCIEHATEKAFPDDEDWYAHGVTDADYKSVERMRDGKTSYWNSMRRFDNTVLQLTCHNHPSVHVDLAVRFLVTPLACARAKQLHQRLHEYAIAEQKCLEDIDNVQDE